MLHWPLNPAVVALAVSLLACGRAPTNEPRTPSEANAPPRNAKLHFEARGGKPFPYPLVHVTVAGTPTTMIVDTGMEAHILASSFVKRLGLATNVG